MKLSRILVLMLIACLGCHGRKVMPEPDETVITPVLAIVSDTLNVEAGSDFWLEHVIENGNDIYAVAARLLYDSSFVQVVRQLDGTVQFESGNYLGNTGHLTVALVNGKQGNLVMAYSKQGEQAGSAGNGLLWKVRMRAIKAGNTMLSFNQSQSAVLSPRFINNVQEKLAAEFVDATLSVEEVVPIRIKLKIAK